jgi:hypothetical protein
MAHCRSLGFAPNDKKGRVAQRKGWLLNPGLQSNLDTSEVQPSLWHSIFVTVVFTQYR